MSLSTFREDTCFQTKRIDEEARRGPGRARGSHAALPVRTVSRTRNFSCCSRSAKSIMPASAVLRKLSGFSTLSAFPCCSSAARTTHQRGLFASPLRGSGMDTRTAPPPGAPRPCATCARRADEPGTATLELPGATHGRLPVNVRTATAAILIPSKHDGDLGLRNRDAHSPNLRKALPLVGLFVLATRRLAMHAGPRLSERPRTLAAQALRPLCARRDEAPTSCRRRRRRRRYRSCPGGRVTAHRGRRPPSQRR
eukprot:scaffold4525_cov403-Prasinococcus_capsulatus_cf.AAC.3